MNFGNREVCDVTFRRQSGLGPAEFTIDTAKMSTMENSSSTVYAQGGKGNSRLRAWEGEKVVTFTIEDALITLESFYALTGATLNTTSKNGVSGIKYSVYPTSFAGYYSIEAKTLFRDEFGIDHDAYITIPNAKLQTTLNLSMAPTGDPSTFTFTLDAFPSNDENDDKLLYSLEIMDNPDADDEQKINVSSLTKTIVYLDGKKYAIEGNNPKIVAVVTETTNVVQLTADASTPETLNTDNKWTGGATITNLIDSIDYATTYDPTKDKIDLSLGSINKLYIV